MSGDLAGYLRIPVYLPHSDIYGAQKSHLRFCLLLALVSGPAPASGPASGLAPGPSLIESYCKLFGRNIVGRNTASSPS